MAVRHLYLARHGDADAFGNLTDTGREQARLLGSRLSRLPIDSIWHSPLPRAADSARELNIFLSGAAPVREAPELIDHVPHVPTREETPAAWVPFFDGYDPEQATAEHRIAENLTNRFATPSNGDADVHELLITHSYPIAWLIRHALDAPYVRWLGLSSANTGLTLIEYRRGLPPNLVMFNDLSHLPAQLRWTGFPAGDRP